MADADDQSVNPRVFPPKPLDRKPSLMPPSASRTGPEPPASATIRLRLICRPMPPPRSGAYDAIELGTQHGRDILPGAEGPDGSMQFDYEVRVKRHPETGRPNFLGPCVHGTPDARFLYLNWTGWSDGDRRQFGRMKVPISSITWEQVESVFADRDACLEAVVSGVGRDGRPACASVPLAEPWTLGERDGMERRQEDR